MSFMGNSWGIYMLAKGDYLHRAHSDQMVLEIVRQGALPHEQWPKDDSRKQGTYLKTGIVIA